jgi:hypothetical protein
MSQKRVSQPNWQAGIRSSADTSDHDGNQRPKNLM